MLKSSRNFICNMDGHDFVKKEDLKSAILEKTWR